MTTGVKDAAFRERCRKFYQQQRQNAMLREGDPVNDIAAFVRSEMERVAESARAADKTRIAVLEEALRGQSGLIAVGWEELRKQNPRYRPSPGLKEAFLATVRAARAIAEVKADA